MMTDNSSKCPSPAVDATCGAEAWMYETEFDVRDYELDYEGIVNNSVYLNYLEHTRHIFSRHLGVNFAELHKRGIDPVLSKAELNYHTPLRSGDTVASRLRMSRKGVRFIFDQELRRKTDNALVLTARITVACLENGRLSRGDLLAKEFGLTL